MAIRRSTGALRAEGGLLTASDRPLRDDSIDAGTLAHRIVDVASEKKASDIVLLNVAELTTMADFFVICSGASERQVQAVAEALIAAGEAAGRAPLGVEGLRTARWVLVDFGDVIAHVFTPDERSYYRLERLWGDAPIVVALQ